MATQVITAVTAVEVTVEVALVVNDVVAVLLAEVVAELDCFLAHGLNFEVGPLASEQGYGSHDDAP